MTLEALLARPQPPFVLLDANVMLPQYLRHVFLDLAENDLLAAHWSAEILEEVQRNLLKPKFGLGSDQVGRLIRTLERYFPQALVEGYQKLVPQLAGMTDPKDAHVDAAALKLQRDTYGDAPVVLITSNVKHLPQSAFDADTVIVARPGPFLKRLLDARPRVADVVERLRASLKAPPLTQHDLIAILGRSSCKEFAAGLQAAWAPSAARIRKPRP